MVENRIPVRNGKATYTIPSTTPQGIYQINARYTDDDTTSNGTRHYAPSETNNTLTITKNAVQGVINNNQEITVHWFEPYTYEAVFTQLGEPIVNGTVKFSLGNNSQGEEIVLGTAVTDENGYAALNNIQLNPAEVPSINYDSYSTVPLFITLQDSTTYNTTPLTTIIKIRKRQLGLTINSADTFNMNETLRISGYVYDIADENELERITGLPIEYYVSSNKIATVNTVGNPISATVSYEYTESSKRNPGKYKLYATFPGNRIYEPVTASQDVYIRDSFTIEAKSVSAFDNESVKISAVIRDFQGIATPSIKAQCIITDDDTGNVLFTSTEKGSDSKGYIEFSYAPAKSSSLTQTITWRINADNSKEQSTATATLTHQRATGISYTANPTSVTYGGTGTWSFYIHDSANKAVKNVECNAYIQASTGTTRTKINTAPIKTNNEGVGTFSYKYDKTMTGGNYVVYVLNDDTDYYKHFTGNQGLGQKVNVKIINKPVIEVSKLTCSESFDHTKSKFGAGSFTDMVNSATFTATVYRNKKEDGPFPNLSIDGMILKYDIGDTPKTFNLRGDGANKIPVTTNANGVASLTVEIPCAKFALDNICEWTINANSDSGEFHTKVTKNQDVKVKRHINITVPAQELRIDSDKNVVSVNAMDSHGDDINQVTIALDISKKKGGAITVAEGQTSYKNVITKTNYSLPYTTQAISPRDYYVNAWSTNTGNYISPSYFSSVQGEVYTSVTPTFTIEVNPDYQNKPTQWKVPENTNLKADGKVAFKITARYPLYVSGTGVQNKIPTQPISYTYLLDGTNIGGGTLNNQGEHIIQSYTIPETTAYKNKFKAVITSTSKYYPVDENPQTILKIIKTLLYKPIQDEMSMSTQGKLYIRGQFTTLYGKPAANIKVQPKLSDANSTMGVTLYKSDGSVFQLTTDENGWVDTTYDNTTSNPHAISLTNNKEYYLHYKSGTTGYSDVYGGTKVYVGNGYKIIVYGGNFLADHVEFKARVLNHKGQPMKGVECWVRFNAINLTGSINMHLTTDNDGYISYVKDYSDQIPKGTYIRSNGTLKINTGNYIYEGAEYEGIQASAKIYVYHYRYNIVPQITQLTTTQYGNIELHATVYADGDNLFLAQERDGFKVVDYYSGATLPGEYSTDNAGVLSVTLNTNQDAKWYSWKYQLVHPAETGTVYAESPVITVKNQHAITGEATPITCKYNEDIGHNMIIRIADKSYRRGTTAGIKGSYSYTDETGQTKTDTYNMVGMAYNLYLDSKGQGKAADFVSLMGGATLTLKEDGILGDSSQRSWTNTNYSVAGTYNLVLKPVLSQWTTDQKEKYVQSNITLRNAITITT